MKTLTIDRNKLLDALMDLNHAAADPRIVRWLVAVRVDGDEATARIIWADTPSMLGGYFANEVGEDNYSPNVFLSEGNIYTWGEAGWGSGPNREWTEEDTEGARIWIDDNLLESVFLDDEAYEVRYITESLP